MMICLMFLFFPLTPTVRVTIELARRSHFADGITLSGNFNPNPNLGTKLRQTRAHTTKICKKQGRKYTDRHFVEELCRSDLGGLLQRKVRQKFNRYGYQDL